MGCAIHLKMFLKNWSQINQSVELWKRKVKDKKRLGRTRFAISPLFLRRQDGNTRFEKKREGRGK